MTADKPYKPCGTFMAETAIYQPASGHTPSTRHLLNRRDFLAFAAMSLVAGRRGLAAAGSLRLTALGQSLILRDLAAQRSPGYEAIRARLAQSDVCFSNLEAAIRGASARDAKAPEPNGVIAEALVLDSLKQLSINLLSLSNNHADNLGEPGFFSTLEETRSRGFTVAGTGRTLSEASRPGELKLRDDRTVALVAMASNAIGEQSFASATRPGVNHVAERNGIVDPMDSERILMAIKTAAAKGDWVVVYQHDHYWAPDWQDTPDWKKRWCRACIDAGAAAFISHGVPLLHGIEIYKKRPIFYGLGNFIFHLSIQVQGNVPTQYQQTECWQSIIAGCEFEGGELRALRLEPITLKNDEGVGEGQYKLHGNPRFAEGREAADILTRLQRLSKAVGTDIEIRGSSGRVRL
jgi:poly-gamma-glutamate capsule biosynthesis protein CapA/YwtB (metallophosphatase superfamily)